MKSRPRYSILFRSELSSGLYCHVKRLSTDVSEVMEEVRTSETSVDNLFTWQYNAEDSSEHHTRRRENLKSHISNSADTAVVRSTIFSVPLLCDDNNLCELVSLTCF
jgi:hypothetical protein